MGALAAKHVLIWFMLSASGDMTSGAAEFDNRAACDLATFSLIRMAHQASEKAGRQAPMVEAACHPKKS